MASIPDTSELLHEVTQRRREKGLQPAVLTFDPHPASIVAPHRAARLLTTQAERCSVLAREGIEYVLVLPFTREMAHWTPEQFVERVLVKALRARVVIVGDNFRFGHEQAGDTKVLTQLGQRFGFETRVITPVKRRGRTVSSSEIRRAVEAGKVALAARLLGRPYATAGVVVPGHGIGSKQTVPTLNLRTHAQVLPATGVYITRTFDEESAAPLEFDHQRRLSPHVRRSTRSRNSPSRLSCWIRSTRPHPSTSAWNFCAACATNASSNRRRRSRRRSCATWPAPKPFSGA